MARPGQVPWARAVADAVVGAARGGTVERVVFAGTSHLAGGGFEPDAMGAVLDALEEQVVLLKLLHEMAAEPGDVTVRIGTETHSDSLRGASVVASAYGPGALVPRRRASAQPAWITRERWPPFAPSPVIFRKPWRHSL